MTTIFAVSNSEGTRRCDATCHEAIRPRCVCACGGRYHGMGSERALGQFRRDVFDEEAAVELFAGIAGGAQLSLTDLLELEAASGRADPP